MNLGGWTTFELTLSDGQKKRMVVPEGDIKEHTMCPGCACRPVQDTINPNLWLHNSFDGREAYETGHRRVH